LLKIFKGWCDNTIDLILATDEEAILRRDIYDRIPTFKWGKGRVTLLGDSVHAMQPNMGQGGCMAIEVYISLICSPESSSCLVLIRTFYCSLISFSNILHFSDLMYISSLFQILQTSLFQGFSFS
jgi:hypothetical protein